MTSRLRLRRAPERPERPPVGYKIAHAMLSADGTRVGFRGVSLGSDIVYGPIDEAECAYGRHHRAPSRWCACGFYALHRDLDAIELTCATEYRDAVLLEVLALGRYERHERGLRFERQRVTRVAVGRCACGLPAQGLTDSGEGIPGWRALVSVCGECVGHRPWLDFAAYAQRAGGRLVAACDDRLPPTSGRGRPAAAPGSGAGAGQPFPSLDGDDLVPQLTAEAALLQARLDWFQVQLARLTGQD